MPLDLNVPRDDTFASWLSSLPFLPAPPGWAAFAPQDRVPMIDREGGPTAAPDDHGARPIATAFGP